MLIITVVDLEPEIRFFAINSARKFREILPWA